MKVAVVGATGIVGETILKLLDERRMPIGELGAFASRPRSNAVHFRGLALDVRATSHEALFDYDVVFFASGEEASERYAPALVERGSVVIDNSPTFRLQRGIALIVPQVNGDAISGDQRLFPVANCTAIVLCTGLRQLRDLAGLRAVRVATYQAASGAGRAGLQELIAGERAIVANEPEPATTVFPGPLARNVLPQVGELEPSGWSGEERKILAETRKLLDLPELFLDVIAVRVPVRTAHSEAVFVETERPVTADRLVAAYEAAPGIVIHRQGIVTPRDVEGTDDVHVARVRAWETHVAFWCVGDQLRKGAATNAVEILELLLQKGHVAA